MSHTYTPIADGHNDTLIHLYLPEGGAGRYFFTRSESGHIDLPRAREGGLAGAFFPIFVSSPAGRKLSPPDPNGVTRTPGGHEIMPFGLPLSEGPCVLKRGEGWRMAGAIEGVECAS